MSKKFRDFLFIAFIALFVFITFFVSVYAVGYSLNISWPPRFNQIFQRTGMLILDSEPTGASIFLNDNKQRRSFFLDLGRDEITTPVKIKNLAPGEYTLRLEKEGYWPLEKKVSIYPGQSTFAEDFILFKRSLPLNLALCGPQEISVSPDSKNIFLANDGTIINLKTENSKQLVASGGAGNIQWSQDGSQILFNGGLLKLDGSTSSYDLSALGKDANDFYWDEKNKKIYYRSGSSIACVLTDKNTASTILKGGDYVAYAVRDRLIYTVEKQGEENYLKIYEADNALLRSSSALPSGDYSFYQDDYHLNLYDRKQQSLYLLSDYSAQSLSRQIRPVSSWQWLNKNFLIWHNEFEIYSLDTANNRQELLIRVSEPLSGIAWNQAKNYLIYASDTQIQIVNLSLDKKTPIVLLKAEKVSKLYLDEKNQLLYFYAQIGQQAGIYKLQLQ